MSRQSPALRGVQFTVIDVPVPTFQDGLITRPATVAFRRSSHYTLKIGVAICNLDKDEFSSEAGRDIALGRLTKRPISLRTEAYTVEGIEAAIRSAATVQNLWQATRRIA